MAYDGKSWVGRKDICRHRVAAKTVYRVTLAKVAKLTKSCNRLRRNDK